MITLNNKPYEWAAGLTVEKLLALEKIDYKNRSMVVKVNGDFVSMKKYHETAINDEDEVLMVQFSPGG